MHAFMLILAILGQPERAVMICETYQQCSDSGAAAQADYVRMFDKRPRDFSYRVVPVIIVPEGPQT
jgi:hypothetical protein